MLSIDFEWQLGHHEEQTATGGVLTHTQKRRDFGDVLSVQYAMFLPDYPNVKIHGIIFNNNDKGFNFRALMLKFVDIIQKEFHALDHNQRPIVLNLKKLKLLLTGYFLGVDFSCMTGWNKLPIKLTVLGKHRIFSRIPYKFMLRRRKGAEPVTVTMTIRDTASIAPMGGLKELGEIVGQLRHLTLLNIRTASFMFWLDSPVSLSLFNVNTKILYIQLKTPSGRALSGPSV